jgi:hypothetical protein
MRHIFVVKKHNGVADLHQQTFIKTDFAGKGKRKACFAV